MLATKAKVNPDNIATPLAAALGDVASISLLAFMTSFLFNNICEDSQSVADLAINELFSPFRHSSVDCLRDHWNLLRVVAVLGARGLAQRLRAAGLEKRLDSGSLSSVHQRASYNMKYFSELSPLIFVSEWEDCF